MKRGLSIIIPYDCDDDIVINEYTKYRNGATGTSSLEKNSVSNSMGEMAIVRQIRDALTLRMQDRNAKQVTSK